ncbi:CRISPR-associated helicase/endonuclease Cas3 [Pueribacillus theae]|uniref:CRISPR-associated helicase/endonuclease Cas3 n=1 Tax=Pueribacillus theae TaxID=2171751 RepID=A0A2U1K7W3_9BACI|nr:CRISPR-associated helicase Cas3' [Pueribacillus theae]PWA13093.1 CRISPR-associated helicase/endonuclease Cas3 [Pueribacillus theae]
MSRLVSLVDCIARPDDGKQRYYLVHHLEGVRCYTHSFFQKENIEETERKLLEFAALSHDIGKAHYDWQAYINGEQKTGPNHSGCGAIFFSYLAYHWLKIRGEWDVYKSLWLQLTRDIADHHGSLKGFIENEDIEKGSFEKMDMLGIQEWIYRLFPIYEEEGVSFNAKDLNDWQCGIFEDLVDDAIYELHLDKRKLSRTPVEMMDIIQRWRTLTTVLISSDRFEIQNIPDKRVENEEWDSIVENIKSYCNQGNQHPLADVRANAQKDILEQWEKVRDCSYFVLEMPTGYGKTVTALKLASEIGKTKKLSKIIYVAPYISILEQNAEAIFEAIKKVPIQHHSMAILNEKTLEENSQTDKHSDLYVQAWANDIVCTSFVQWMKAIFPRRAQETLRRVYLKDAIVIIDEPQIINASVWNLFLVGLQSIAGLCNLTIIFCSATMPPFYEKLKEIPKQLSIGAKEENNRYQIKIVGEQTCFSCAERLSSLTEPSGAAILNTIQDAIDVYEKLPYEENVENYLIHGLMIPMHKSIQLNKINTSISNQRERRTNNRIRVVSTQIIEAGVDLSFHYMYRALPILPSLVQAAGRVNRHRELPIGKIETGIFLRDEKDTRFIYDSSLCRISDELLFQRDEWYEHEMDALVKRFYEQMFTENSYESVLQDIEAAVGGNWEKVSRHDVFKSDDYYRLPLFIPFQWENEKNWISNPFKRLLEEFKIENPKQIYNLFLDKKTRLNWSYAQNKRFNLLFNQFVLNVPVEKALKLAENEDFIQYRVPLLEDEYSYSLEKGLKIAGNEVSNSII